MEIGNVENVRGSKFNEICILLTVAIMITKTVHSEKLDENFLHLQGGMRDLLYVREY